MNRKTWMVWTIAGMAATNGVIWLRPQDSSVYDFGLSELACFKVLESDGQLRLVPGL